MKFLNLIASSLLLMSAVGCGGTNETKSTVESNPFFAGEWTDNYGLPPFDKIKDEHFLPAIEEGMKLHNAEIDAIVNNPEIPSYTNTIIPYVEAGEFLSRARAVFSNLASSDLTPERAKLQQKITPMLSAHNNNISLNEKLFQRVKSVYDGMNKAYLSTAEKRLIKKIYDGFARSGANLSSKDKVKYKELSARQSELTMKYGNNLLKQNAAFSLVIEDEKDLAGLPESSIAAAAELATANDKDGKWMFNLSYPSYFPFMTYSTNRELRKFMFEGYSTRGFGSEDTDTEPLINELVNVRIEIANLLGYKNYAEYVLEKNMAEKSSKVYDLIETMWKPSIKAAGKELKDMKKLMKKDGIKDDFEPWDWWYYADKVRAEKYALDNEMTAPYFEVENVRNGVFLLLNKLFGVNFEEMPDAPKSHPNMRAYKVTEADGSLIGVITQDLHPRSTKRGGAWCSSFRSQKYKDGERVTPVSLIVCNFTAPTADAPALLSLDETMTFFHEMGHAIQGLLGDIKVNGLAGVSRDFVELPSQILEAWCMDPIFLRMYAKHYKTGEVIPDDIIAKMQESSKFNKGFEITEFLAAAYLDMEYHTIKKKGEFDVVEFEENAMEALGLIEEIIPRYRSTYFTHIFSGGYAAGYYGYKWADVLVADAYQAFIDTGDIFNPELCLKYRKEILEPWGTLSENDMYRNFRGKDANMKYLMEKTF